MRSTTSKACRSTRAYSMSTMKLPDRTSKRPIEVAPPRWIPRRVARTPQGYPGLATLKGKRARHMHKVRGSAVSKINVYWELARCPLYPRKRTFSEAALMSAKCP